jgi:acetyl esterase/lipase
MRMRLAPVDLLNAAIPPAGITVERGIAYGPGPRHRLDLYRPRPAGRRPPLAMFLYGGSWNSGARADYRFAGICLARLGWLVAVPDYRLHPEVQFPAFVEDAARAAAFLARERAALGAAPDGLRLIGHSAGAHIAAMLALDARRLAAAGAGREVLAGCIGLAGPYDFLPMRSAAVRAVFPDPESAETQPIHFVDAAAPPLLLLHGGADRTVEPGNSTRLAARVRAAGGLAACRVYPGLGHVGIILALTPLLRWRAPVLRDIAAFMPALHDSSRTRLAFGERSAI